MTDLTDDEREMLAGIAARLDDTDGPLPVTVLPQAPRLRDALTGMLARRGRVLVDLLDTDPPMVTTTIADPIADRFVTDDLGLLSATDRAVLALVLLRCIVEPTVQGNPPPSWSAGARVHRGERLKSSQVPDRHITESLGRLHELRLVHATGANVGPGPALDRLTPRAKSRIERDLIELVAGDDPSIVRILDNVSKDDPTRSPK